MATTSGAIDVYQLNDHQQEFVSILETFAATAEGARILVVVLPRVMGSHGHGHALTMWAACCPATRCATVTVECHSQRQAETLETEIAKHRKRLQLDSSECVSVRSAVTVLAHTADFSPRDDTPLCVWLSPLFGMLDKQYVLAFCGGSAKHVWLIANSLFDCAQTLFSESDVVFYHYRDKGG